MSKPCFPPTDVIGIELKLSQLQSTVESLKEYIQNMQEAFINALRQLEDNQMSVLLASAGSMTLPTTQPSLTQPLLPLTQPLPLTTQPSLPLSTQQSLPALTQPLPPLALQPLLPTTQPSSSAHASLDPYDSMPATPMPSLTEDDVRSWFSLPTSTPCGTSSVDVTSRGNSKTKDKEQMRKLALHLFKNMCPSATTASKWEDVLATEVADFEVTLRSSLSRKLNGEREWKSFWDSAKVACNQSIKITDGLRKNK